jgi:hypothetical protein
MDLRDTELLVLTQWAQVRVEALDRVIELRNRILAAWTPYRDQCKTLGEFRDTHPELSDTTCSTGMLSTDTGRNISVSTTANGPASTKKRTEGYDHDS